MTLRLRILAVALIPLLLAVGLFAAYLIHRSTSEVRLSLDRQGLVSAKHLANSTAHDLFSGNLPQVKRLLDYELGLNRMEAAAITDGANWLLVSGNLSTLPKLTGGQLPPRWQKGAFLLFAHAIRLPPANDMDPYITPLDASAPTHYLIVSLSQAPIATSRSSAVLAASGTALIAIVFAMLLAWRLSGHLSRPLHRIINTVAHLASGELTERTAETSRGEIGLLEQGVNQMAQALEENQRNLTLRVQEATAELLGQKLAAEAAVLAKSRFLAAASHDLRQPLHALTLLVAALREQVSDGEAARLARHIESSASAMESLLNALLDLSKLDAGEVVALPRCFRIDLALQQVASQFLPVAEARGIRLKFAATNLCCQSDPILVERILANLVSNALRYTDHGQVLVAARRAGQDWVRFEVRDTGKGIPAEFQAKIFEEYFQLENTERDRDKGLGLGLSIVTRLASLLGSKMQVRSTPGKGSCFSFQLARCQAATDQIDISKVANSFTLPLDNALVAFIDDDESILTAMLEVFDQWNVALAAGEDATQVCAELKALGRAPDLILCDYRLRDGQTGVEAVQLLRAAFGADIPAALITGDTASDTIQSIQSFNLPVLHKPIKPARLRAFMSHLLSKSSTSPSSTHRPDL